MSAQPEPIGALIPDAVPLQRGQVSRRAWKRGYIPKTYSEEEVNAARRVIAHWNRQFKGVDGAYRANANDSCNVKAFVRMLRACNKSDGLFEFGEQDACRAITGYRNDPNNGRLGRWKRFKDWLTPENIDFYVGRHKVAEHRVAQPATVKRKVDARTAAARRIIEHEGIVDLACIAARTRGTLQTLIDGSPTQPLSKRIASLLHRRAMLNETPLAALSKRARTVFEAAFHRPPGADRQDRARLDGIELALLDPDSQRTTREAR